MNDMSFSCDRLNFTNNAAWYAVCFYFYCNLYFLLDFDLSFMKKANQRFI